MQISIVCIDGAFNLEGGQEIWIWESWIKTGDIDDFEGWGSDGGVR